MYFVVTSRGRQTRYGRDGSSDVCSSDLGTGTPVMAAGDGVIVEMRRWGGYVNWMRIRHSGGYESGYAHLSKYASGLRVGQRVNQGEVVAYVGSTGRSTGPHLHHEIWFKGQRVDPKGAKVPSGTVLEGMELAAFKAQKRKVDQALKGYETQFAGKKSGGLRRSEEHTSELQSRQYLVCRLLLEKKKKTNII